MKKNYDFSPKMIKQMLSKASEAALVAGKYAEKNFGRFKSLQVKPDTSLVTEVDKNSEKIILKHLTKSFPKHGFNGEESGRRAGKGLSSEFQWHIDPIDGTTNFVHGFPMFCVSIGVEHVDWGPILGVIYHPILKELYTASIGNGAYKNKKRIRVSTISKLKEAVLTTGFSLRRREYSNSEMKCFESLVSDTHAIRRTGSAALDLCYVASGVFEGFWERGLAPWDVAAGSVIVKEAGGMLTKMDGSPFSIHEKSLLASNGLIHDKFLELIR
jgi:myo-inositol-1(or 4)-monophosphatase